MISALGVTGYLTVNKFIYKNYGISAIEYSILFAAMGGICGLASFLKNTSREKLLETRKNISGLIALGVAGTLAVGIYTIGLHYTSAVNASILVTGTIVATTIFAILLLKEIPTIDQVLWSLVLFLGLYIAIVGFHAIHFRVGDLIVLLSLVFFGFGNAYSRVVMKRMQHPTIVPDARLVVGLATSILLGVLVIRDYGLIVKVLPLALLAGLFYWITMKTFARAVYFLNATDAVVINQSQIFTTSIVAVLLLGETYSFEKLIGSVVVIISVYFISARKRLVSK